MIHEEIVQSPKQQIFEGWITKVRVDIHDRSLHDDVLNLAGKRCAAGLRKNGFHSGNNSKRRWGGNRTEFLQADKVRACRRCRAAVKVAKRLECVELAPA